MIKESRKIYIFLRIYLIKNLLWLISVWIFIKYFPTLPYSFHIYIPSSWLYKLFHSSNKSLTKGNFHLNFISFFNNLRNRMKNSLFTLGTFVSGVKLLKVRELVSWTYNMTGPYSKNHQLNYLNSISEIFQLTSLTNKSTCCCFLQKKKKVFKIYYFYFIIFLFYLFFFALLFNLP